MRQKILQAILVIPIIFGFFWLYKIIFLDAPKVEKNPFSYHNIQSQRFLIPSSKDTIIESKSGSLLVFHKYSFVDEQGDLIKGKIEIEYKEITNRLDIIYAALTTTTNGKILETGGMVYLNAFSNGLPVQLSDSGKIGLAIETDSILPDMKVYKGQIQQNIINWNFSSSVLSDTIIRIVQQFQWNQDEITKDEAFKLGILKADTLTGDIIFEGLENDNSDLPEIGPGLLEELREDTDISSQITAIGVNMFREDLNQKYIFELYGLGWANIDRLYYDNRTKPVNLTVMVSNYQDFGEVYITMVFADQNIFLPGYQKVDKTFSFTHGDYEVTKLPVGEDAVIIATSSKKGKPFIDIKPITISEKEEIHLTLKETTKDKLKKLIEENI